MAPVPTLPRLISVVIPAFNASGTLPAQLDALCAQTYRGAWEVIVADNGSTDGTAELARRWSAALPGFRVVDASGKRGASHARNVGVAAARGDFLVFCDADDVATPGWLEEMARGAFDGDLVRGALDRETLNGGGHPPDRPEDRAPIPVHGFLPFASTANLGLRADVLRALGGWNNAFAAAHDVEFSWRAQLAGYRFAVAPRAVMRKRDRADLRGLSRQAYVYGRENTRLYRAFRGSGMPRSSVRAALWNWIKIVTGVPYLLMGSRHRQTWVRLAAHRWGRLTGSIRHRVLFL